MTVRRSLEGAFFSRNGGRFWVHCSPQAPALSKFARYRVECFAVGSPARARPSAGIRQHALYILPE